MEMSVVPATLPASEGHDAELELHEDRGLQVTVDAEEVKVTFIEEAGMPMAFAASSASIFATVVAQVCPAQPAPWTAATRAVMFTASARVWYCHIPKAIYPRETMTKSKGIAVIENSSIAEPRREEEVGRIVYLTGSCTDRVMARLLGIIAGIASSVTV